MERRTWVYVQTPDNYGFPAHSCGQVADQWSEFVGHLWCEKCSVDFKPDHGGVFDGPVPLHTAGLLGLSFDRYNLETGQIEPAI